MKEECLTFAKSAVIKSGDLNGNVAHAIPDVCSTNNSDILFPCSASMCASWGCVTVFPIAGPDRQQDQRHYVPALALPRQSGIDRPAG